MVFIHTHEVQMYVKCKCTSNFSNFIKAILKKFLQIRAVDFSILINVTCPFYIPIILNSSFFYPVFIFFKSLNQILLNIFYSLIKIEFEILSFCLWQCEDFWLR